MTIADDPIAGRLPPQAIEAEQAVLGGLLIDNHAWERVAGLLSERDFYRDDHRRIYLHIQSLIDKNRPADMLTVFESIEQSGDKGKAGGLAYLGALAQNTPSAHNIRRYAEIVHERAIQRALIDAASDIANAALNPASKDLGDLLDEAERRIFEISEHRSRGRQGPTKIHPILVEVLQRVNSLFHANNTSGITGVATGFVDLDNLTSGLQPSDLIVVAGRPSMGKTAFALNIAERIAAIDRLPVVIFSMEMSGTQLGTRMISTLGRLDQSKLRNGRLTDEDWGHLTDAVSKLQDAPLEIDETPALNCLELRSRARRLAREYGGLGLIIVDYLQLMSATSRNENRATEISEISRSLKALAKELKVPVMALSQLNRALEQRTDKRPVMSDLRESGAIEQDADIIMLLYRDDYYTREASQEPGVTEIIVAKHRNGPTGIVKLVYLKEYCRFENLALSGIYP
jgi:replicative DNA helicase